MKEEYLFSYVFPIAIVIFGLYLSFYTDILKDISTNIKKPYSFSRTQLMWWSLIIASCFCASYGINGKVGDLKDPSLLILLGISLGTVTSSRMIDSTDIEKGLPRHQNDTGSNLLFDIIKDENGFSVPRFQALLFNLIFGILFIYEFIHSGKGSFINFSPQELTLMGISSAAYLGVKLSENKN